MSVMATDVLDNQEMKEAQRDYLDFLDDDVSAACCSVTRLAVLYKRGLVQWRWTRKKRKENLAMYFISQ